MPNEIDYTKLGGLEQIEKQSDFQLGAVSSAEPIPESYMTPYSGVINHQHQTPSCGAHAGAYIKNIQDNGDFSPEYLWKRIKLIDGFPATDGTNMISIFKVLQKNGVCTSTTLPNSTLLPLDQYTNPKTLTAVEDTEALQARIGAYAFQWNPTFDNLKRAIYEHKEVLMLIRVGAEWWTGDHGSSWQEKDILPLNPTYSITSGHFVTAIGYDKDYIYFLNEWGDTWGRKGIGYFGENYMQRVLQIGTCFDLTEKAPIVFTRTLTLTLRGTDVGVLQQILKDKGFFNHSVTGFFGVITLKAVEDFQHSKGLKMDGVVGPLTFAQLTV